jgi:hypothetical protein
VDDSFRVLASGGNIPAQNFAWIFWPDLNARFEAFAQSLGTTKTNIIVQALEALFKRGTECEFSQRTAKRFDTLSPGLNLSGKNTEDLTRHQDRQQGIYETFKNWGMIALKSNRECARIRFFSPEFGIRAVTKRANLAQDDCSGKGGSS